MDIKELGENQINLKLEIVLEIWYLIAIVIILFVFEKMYYCIAQASLELTVLLSPLPYTVPMPFFDCC